MLGALACSRPAQQQHEFLAAQPQRDRVAIAVGAEHAGADAQHVVPHLMAVRVVHALEVIEIDQRHRIETLPLELGEAGLDCTAVEQARERVALGHGFHRERLRAGTVTLVLEDHEAVRRAERCDDELERDRRAEGEDLVLRRVAEAEVGEYPLERDGPDRHAGDELVARGPAAAQDRLPQRHAEQRDQRHERKVEDIRPMLAEQGNPGGLGKRGRRSDPGETAQEPARAFGQAPLLEQVRSEDRRGPHPDGRGQRQKHGNLP